MRILEENEEGYVYAQPDDIGRQTFDKYVFRDNAELTIGRIVTIQYASITDMCHLITL